MEKIKIENQQNKIKSAIKLKNKFEQIIKESRNSRSFVNTEASLYYIILGSIEYFDKLNDDFLGSGNNCEVPSGKADQFANNFYRLKNSIESLSRYWKIECSSNKDIMLLEDVRTLIVHSGEMLKGLNLIQFKDYKNAQLGRIFYKDSNSGKLFNEGYDYRIQIWTDKHDKNKKCRLNNYTYNQENRNQRDINVFMNTFDIRTIILSYVDEFINKVTKKIKRIKKTPKNKSIKKIPMQLEKTIVKEINIDKLEDILKNQIRGGYIIENGIDKWDGFGLKKLNKYVETKPYIPQKIRDKIKKKISDRLKNFYDDYNNENISDFELPSLDIRDVFKDCTPEYKQKFYFEREKMFTYIAPTFHRKNSKDLSDIDYLLKFILEAQNVLGVDLNIENTADGIICDYFVKSVQVKMMEAEKI